MYLVSNNKKNLRQIASVWPQLEMTGQNWSCADRPNSMDSGIKL
jgi:hypothetical protein